MAERAPTITLVKWEGSRCDFGTPARTEGPGAGTGVVIVEAWSCALILCLVNLRPLVGEPSLSSRNLLGPRQLSKCALCRLSVCRAALGGDVSLSNCYRSLVAETVFMNESGLNSASLRWRRACWSRDEGLPGFLPSILTTW